MPNPRPLRVFLAVSLLGNGLLVMCLLYVNGRSIKQEIRVDHHRPEKQLQAITAPKVYGHSIDSRELIFIGGVPRSGTTLIRAMLDAHPSIRCGEETRVIPRMLSMRSKWMKAEIEHRRLIEAGLNDSILDKAVRAFVSEIIESNGPPADYLCNKDPLSLNFIKDLLRMYPKAKFILMIRDGRAVAYSIVSRNVTITGVNSKSYLSAALFWNKITERMTTDCRMVGSETCLQVYYEELVEEPQQMMKSILQFLGVKWHDNVLKHHKFINSEVLLSKLEPSSNQVRQAIHTKSVNLWRDKLPMDIQQRIYEECDLLKELGYSR